MLALIKIPVPNTTRSPPFGERTVTGSTRWPSQKLRRPDSPFWLETKTLHELFTLHGRLSATVTFKVALSGEEMPVSTAFDKVFMPVKVTVLPVAVNPLPLSVTVMPAVATEGEMEISFGVAGAGIGARADPMANGVSLKSVAMSDLAASPGTVKVPPDVPPKT